MKKPDQVTPQHLIFYGREVIATQKHQTTLYNLAIIIYIVFTYKQKQASKSYMSTGAEQSFLCYAIARSRSSVSTQMRRDITLTPRQ